MSTETGKHKCCFERALLPFLTECCQKVSLIKLGLGEINFATCLIRTTVMMVQAPLLKLSVI